MTHPAMLPIRCHDPHSGNFLGQIARPASTEGESWGESTTAQRHAVGVMLGQGWTLTWLGFHRVMVSEGEASSWLLLHRVSKDGKRREPCALDYHGDESQRGSAPLIEAMKRGCRAGLDHSPMLAGRRSA